MVRLARINVKPIFLFSLFVVVITLMKAQKNCLSVYKPHSTGECHDQADDKYKCCYVYVEYANHTNTTKCYPVLKDFDFVPMFVQEYDVGGGKYEQARFNCASDPQKTCAMSHPHDLDDCRSHGNDHSSCCFFKNRTGDTNCILSTHQFDKQVNYTYLGNLVQCSGSYLQGHSFYFILLLFTIFNFI